MQPHMVVDYCDGTKKTDKFSHLFFISVFAKSLQIKKLRREGDRYVYDVSTSDEKLLQSAKEVSRLYGMDLDLVLEMFDAYFESTKVDPVMRNYVIAYNDYYNRKGENYLVTKKLTDTFKRTKLTLKGKHLPIGHSGFVEFRDNTLRYQEEDCMGMFYTCDRIDDDNVISCSFASSSKAILYFSIGVPDDKLICDEFNERCKYSFEYTMKKELTGEYPYDNFIHIAISTIVFIGNKCEDFKTIRNEFSTKPSKYESQIKQFTPKSYILVGNNFHVVKGPSTETSTVTGHFKWRWVGEGCSQLRLLWWNEHSRNIHK